MSPTENLIAVGCGFLLIGIGIRGCVWAVRTLINPNTPLPRWLERIPPAEVRYDEQGLPLCMCPVCVIRRRWRQRRAGVPDPVPRGSRARDQGPQK